MRRASSYLVVGACLLAATTGSLRQAGSQPAASPAASPSLDYEFFKTKVQGVFLARRPGHARCVVCHTFNNAAFKLVPLSAGSTTWNEEQSRKNFEMASILVNPGDPATSRLLQQPLAPEAGGNVFHSGGRQFASKDDPSWKILVEWVNGEKL